MSEIPTFTVAEMNESNRLAADNFKRAKLAEAEARGTPVGWFIGNAEDGFHQVAKEFEGHEGTTPLYAAQPHGDDGSGPSREKLAAIINDAWKKNREVPFPLYWRELELIANDVFEALSTRSSTARMEADEPRGV